MRGAHLLVSGGRTRRYTGLIPKISPLAVASIALAQLRLDRDARKVDLDAPWSGSRAPAWDAESVASYLERSVVRTTTGKELYEMAIRGLFASDATAVSYLNLLFLVRGHGSINTLFSIEGGAQENLLEGGADSIAQRVADGLGDAVRCRAPVRSITQRDDRVVVDADGVSVAARRVIVAIPPPLALKVRFDPALAPDRAALYALAVAGVETKTLLVYDEPFWRSDGLSGQTAGPGSAAEVTLDGSPSRGAPGVLASFTFGHVAATLHELAPGERRAAVLEAVAERLGRRAASPSELIETSWWDEEWTRGCSMAHFPPGTLTRYGPLLREPFGRVHWAGTETSTTSHGAIDGAVRSGLRAAAEVLDRL